MIKPEKPFLLIYTNNNFVLNYEWLESEEKLNDEIERLIPFGCKIQEAFEIGTYRKINIQ